MIDQNSLLAQILSVLLKTPHNIKLASLASTNKFLHICLLIFKVGRGSLFESLQRYN